MPTRVDHPKTGKVQPNRQPLEPAQGILVDGRVFIELAKKFGVLMRILRGMSSKEAAVFGLSGPADGIELVISQDRAGRSCFAHRACNPQNLSLLRAAVNKITDKDYFSIWMPEDAFALSVVELV